eukprot:TRINITY_DN31594_c0_g1_i1.p1 TRINITY_DN31594_c0_g1~~TRINITY_DN31594_c0_g1_i1.p1  ORF type:complete len:310 (+),score=49.98 TRINITY_DN31594_c0_g1_i1:160-1089(+)
MEAPTGIMNIGNSCYMNAVLQVMQVIFGKILKGDRDVSKQPVLAAMTRLYECTSIPRDASEVKMVMSKNHQMMRGFEQQDAHEFMLAVVNDLNSELKLSADRTVDETLFGTQRTETKCLRCQNSSSNESEFIDIPTVLPQAKTSFLSSSIVRSVPFIGTSLQHTLNDCLNESFKPEKISDYKCSSCNQLVTCERQSTITNPPDVLIFHLQRFTPMLVKLNDSLNIPFTLDMSKFMDRSVTQTPKYRLFATVNHSGSYNFGHYTSVVSTPNGGWYSCNDSQVTELSSPQEDGSFTASEPYILFYKKVSQS